MATAYFPKVDKYLGMDSGHPSGRPNTPTRLRIAFGAGFATLCAPDQDQLFPNCAALRRG